VFLDRFGVTVTGKAREGASIVERGINPGRAEWALTTSDGKVSKA
jgi:hypothetical protein